MIRQGNDRTKGRKVAGFTLTELLVVVAVILGLALLAVPVGQNVVENSRASKCMANLKILAQGAFAYALDNNGSLPDRSNWVYALANKSLIPYLGFTPKTSNSAWDEIPGYATLMTCPSIQAIPKFRPVQGARSYSINQYATGSGGDDTWDSQVRARGAPLKIGNIPQAAKQAFFMDGTLLPSGTGYRYSTHQAPDRIAPLTNDWPGTPGTRTPFVHRGYINVVFLDGHVEMVSEQRAKEELVGNTNGNVKDSTRTHPFWGATK